jgi:hypothetical protein
MRSTLAPLSARSASVMLTLKTRDLAEDIARDGCCARINWGWLLRNASLGWLLRKAGPRGIPILMVGAMVRMTPG